MEDIDAAAPTAPGWKDRKPAPGALMLGLLTFIYTLNFIDRQIVVILQEPIKREFALADWQLGLLTGASLSLFYTAMCLPIGHLIDRGVPRAPFIAAATAVWSLMTALCGMTGGCAQFVVARLGVGVAEAGFSPAAHSLISDLYPAQRRPAAIGVFATGIPLGIMFGLSMGGAIAQHYSWRIALLLVGLPGLIVALSFRLIAREPKRGGMEPDAAAAGAPADAGAIWRLMRHPAYFHVVLGSAGTSFVVSALQSWLPSFLIRVHGLSQSKAGFTMGAIIGASGFVGTGLGGWASARLAARGLHAMLWLPAAGLALAIPLFLAVLLVGDGNLAIGLLVLPLTLASIWSAPSIALQQSVAPVPLRATASSIYLVVSNLLGVASGPLAVGFASDRLVPHAGSPAQGLRFALVEVVALLVWGSAHWLLAMRVLARRA